MRRDAKDKKLSTTSWTSLFDAVTEFASAERATVQGGRMESLTRSRSEKALSEAQQLLERRTVIKDRFLLEELLGYGGMGSVYKARDLRKVEAQDRSPWIAIKLLNEDFRKHPAALISLQREARKSQALTHPNIIQVFDFDRDDDVVFMTMELLRGEDLSQTIQQHPEGVGLEKTQAISRAVGSALQHAHDNQICHADLTPKNIFLTEEGKIKVLDFGIAQAIALADAGAEDSTDTVFDPATLGGLTPAYAGLERLEGKPPERADDVFALGCIVYQLLRGVHPYKGRSAREAQELRIRPARISSLSSKQWRALLKAMALSRAQRHQTVEDFLDEFCPLSGSISKLSVLAIAGVLLMIAVLGYQSLVNVEQERRREAELQRQQLALSASQKAQALQAQEAARTVEQNTLEYLALAKTLLEKNRHDEAQLYLQRIQVIAPEHPQLLTLEQELLKSRETSEQRLRELASRESEIKRILHEANDDIAAGKLVRPADDNAFDNYRQILALDAGNVAAKSLLQQMVQLHLDGMDRALRNDKPQLARALLTDLARIAPDNPNIDPLEVEIEQALARQQERQRQVDALITQANALSAEGGVVQGGLLYEKVLAMDPDNQAALAGLEMARTEIAKQKQQVLQQSRENAQSLLRHAQQLLAKRPASPENFNRARELLLESRRLSPNYSAVDLQLEQLPQHYVEAVQRKIEQEKYDEAESFLQATIMLSPQNGALVRLQEQLDGLAARENVLVPTSF